VIRAWLLVIAGTGLSCIPALAKDAQYIDADHHAALVKDSSGETLGAAKADVTIVEFFDYNCPYCKRFAPTLRKLLREDTGAAVVYKDWPILGEVSAYAARSALAAQWQHKYFAAHDTLLGASHLASHQQVDSLLQGAGIDMIRLAKDRVTPAAEIDAVLARNESQARALGFRGTPGVVIGRAVFFGSVSASDLKQLIATSRKEEPQG
jgi:protein-disulfide isomerase